MRDIINHAECIRTTFQTILFKPVSSVARTLLYHGTVSKFVFRFMQISINLSFSIADKMDNKFVAELKTGVSAPSVLLSQGIWSRSHYSEPLAMILNRAADCFSSVIFITYYMLYQVLYGYFFRYPLKNILNKI